MARKLVKKDTVLLDNVLAQQKENPDKAKAIEMAYKISHSYSMRAPERAAEIISPDVEFRFGLFPPMKDFHVTIDDVIFEGSMKEGRIAFSHVLSGIWTGEVAGIKPPRDDCKIEYVSYLFLDVKNGIVEKIKCIITAASVPEWNQAWDKWWTIAANSSAK